LTSIFKQEKGADALRKLNQSQSSGRVKVSGGAKGKKAAGGKKSKSASVVKSLLSGGNNKRSTAHLKAGEMKSPGDFADKHSANLTSMKQFKQFMNKIKEKKGQKPKSRK
jgi:hypothetical protein